MHRMNTHSVEHGMELAPSASSGSGQAQQRGSVQAQQRGSVQAQQRGSVQAQLRGSVQAQQGWAAQFLYHAKQLMLNAKRLLTGQKRSTAMELPLRVLAAAAIGSICLGIAAWVGAEEAAKGDANQIERQVDQAHNYVERIRSMVQAGFNEREEARNSQNVSRVNCVSEALSTMKGMLKIGESMYVAMQECASRKDSACTESEYVKISITFNKCEELEGQLKGCGGPSIDGAIDGRPVIEKVVEDLPDMNPTQGLTDLSPKLETPPSASVFFKMGT